MAWDAICPACHACDGPASDGAFLGVAIDLLSGSWIRGRMPLFFAGLLYVQSSPYKMQFRQLELVSPGSQREPRAWQKSQALAILRALRGIGPRSVVFMVAPQDGKGRDWCPKWWCWWSWSKFDASRSGSSKGPAPQWLHQFIAPGNLDDYLWFKTDIDKFLAKWF